MSKAGISRSLPNDEFQAAVNAANPSAANPFLTAGDIGSVGGSINFPITAIAEDQSNAGTSIYLNPNGTGGSTLVYEIAGVGAALNPGTKVIYMQTIVPAGYGAGGNISLVVSKQLLPQVLMQASINGVADSGIFITNITPTVSLPAYEVQNYTFADTIAPGDIITIVMQFQGAFNNDFLLRGIAFNYNFDIL